VKAAGAGGTAWAAAEAVGAAAPGLRAGSRVEGNYKGAGHWYSGAVTKVHRSGGSDVSFDLSYDDGDTEAGVPTSRVRPLVENVAGAGTKKKRGRPVAKDAQPPTGKRAKSDVGTAAAPPGGGGKKGSADRDFGGGGGGGGGDDDEEEEEDTEDEEDDGDGNARRPWSSKELRALRLAHIAVPPTAVDLWQQVRAW